MSVGQKLTMLKIRSTSVTFLSLRHLEATPEEAMELRRLIKSSNKSLGPLPALYSTSKSLHLIGLRGKGRLEFT